MHSTKSKIIAKPIALNGCAIATIAEISGNQVVSVFWQGEQLDIAYCARTIFQFELGEKVLVQNVDHQLVVIQHLTAETKQQPTLIQQGDAWILQSEKSFQLKVGNSLLDVTADGNVTLEAEDITTQANGVNRLLGHRIELN